MKHLLTVIAVATAITSVFALSAPKAEANHGAGTFCPNEQVIYLQDVPGSAHFPNIYPDDTAVINGPGAQLAIVPQINDTHVIWPQNYDIIVNAGDTLHYRGYFPGHSLSVQLFSGIGVYKVLYANQYFSQDSTTFQVPYSGHLRFPHGATAIEKNALVLCPGTGSNQPSPTPSQVPAAPSNLQGNAVSSSQIQLTWQDNSTNENGFRIERNINGQQWQEIQVTGANTTSFLDTSPVIIANILYRVRAFNAAGNSPYSNTIAVGISPAPTPTPVLNAPSNLTATAVSSSQINLTWTDTTTNESGFLIERSLASDPNYGFVGIDSVPQNQTTYHNINLQANVTYYYRIRTQGPGGASAPSNIASATTFPNNAPPFPTAPQQAPSVTTQPATNITQSSATLNGAVNPNNAPTTAWFEWGQTTSLGNTTSSQSFGSGSGMQSFSMAVSGLQTNATYYFRAMAQNAFGVTTGTILSFTTSFTQQTSQGAPIVNTQSATNVSQNFATLNGNVNPNGSPTNTWFEWGFSNSFGNTTGFQSLGSGSGNFSTSAPISGLAANTTYYFRAVAQNSFGTTYGNTLTFFTSQQFGGVFLPNQPGSAPTVFTNNATQVTPTSAVLSGTVYPNNATTNIWFEWGETPSLSFSAGFQTITLGNIAFPFSVPLQNLSPGTTYYYRAVGQNSFGTNYGNILTFRTPQTGIPSTGVAPTVTTLDASLVTQTSALLNGLINPNSGIAVSRFEWGTTLSLGNVTPSQSLTTGASTVPISWFLSGLAPNTTYYFRAVGEAGGTRYSGSILSFRTLPGVQIPSGNGGGGGTAPSPSSAIPSLTLTSAMDTIVAPPGGEVNYTLRYKNVSETQTLTQIVLKVTLPEGTTLISANYPVTQVGNVLTFNPFSFGPGEENFTVIKARISDDAKLGDTLVFNGVMDYRDSRNRAQSVSTYATVTIGELAEAFANGLAALFTSISIPLGWLILIALIVLIILLATRRMIDRRHVEVRTVTTAPRRTPPTFRPSPQREEPPPPQMEDLG